MKTIISLCAALCVAAATLSAQTHREIPYCVGADVSWLQSQEDKGTVFSADGRQGDAIEILCDKGFNYIRLRIFVDPRSSMGYSHRDGYCDLEHTLTMARRIRQAGASLLLDFHYSDDWADPQKQIMPLAWQTFSREEVEQAVYAHTREVLEALCRQGTPPSMVQVGNEISNGMLWPYGSIRHSFDGLCRLLENGIRAVRECVPEAAVMLHVALGGQNEESVRFFDEMIRHDIDFDLIGQSYYPEWHGTVTDLENNLRDLAVRYRKPLIVVEYRQGFEDIERIMRSLPEATGRGSFIWEATSPKWGNLFDENGAATPAIEAYAAKR